MLRGVDQRAWCYAVEAFAFLHSHIRRKVYPDPRFNGLSPSEVLRVWKNRKVYPNIEEEVKKILAGPTSPVERNFRRFGCLAYVKQHRVASGIKAEDEKDVQGKWKGKAIPCMFLGYNEANSSWRFGMWLSGISPKIPPKISLKISFPHD